MSIPEMQMQQFYENTENQADMDWFMGKYFEDAFYWTETKEVWEELQKVAIRLGLLWHTGDSEIVLFEDTKNRNLVMFKPDASRDFRYFQSVGFYVDGYSYGKPIDFKKMLEDYDKLPI